MSSCCNADDYDRMFTSKEARRDVARFFEKGLEGSEAILADRVAGLGLENASVLEVGAGVGALHVSLLTRGASSATAVDITSNWDDPAADLARRAGVEERVTRVLGDVVELEVGLYDVVVAHRVVCCYPGWQALIHKLVSSARRIIGLTFPRDTRFVKIGLTMGNVFPRLSGLQFRAHVHDPAAMLGVIEQAGFRLVHDSHGLIWRTVVLAR